MGHSAASGALALLPAGCQRERGSRGDGALALIHAAGWYTPLGHHHDTNKKQWRGSLAVAPRPFSVAGWAVGGGSCRRGRRQMSPG
eukprot:scaffold176393_cov31-Tisochrysis_lutea.AAC.3